MAPVTLSRRPRRRCKTLSNAMPVLATTYAVWVAIRVATRPASASAARGGSHLAPTPYLRSSRLVRIHAYVISGGLSDDRTIH